MDYFTLFVYQPFFNILVWLYWMVGKFAEEPDMGIAVIFFAVAVRIILLPFDLISERSDEDKFQISQKIKLIKKEFSDNVVRQKEEIKKIMRQSPGAIISEIFTVIIQLTIIVVLYRIFTTGLEGEDMHLLYPFMPVVKEPINLMFLGKYDLSHTNATLNIIQSLMIGLSEFIHLSLSPVKSSRREFLSLVVIFPVVCFLVFIFLPAGKKVFIISSLAFTILVRLFKHASYVYFASKQAHSDNVAIEEKKV